MQLSKEIHSRPEEGLVEALGKQKTITTSKLLKILEPFLDKLKWQQEALARNVLTIRKLNDRCNRSFESYKEKDRRMQLAENELKYMQEKLDKSALNNHVLASKNKMLEDKLTRAKRTISGLEMDARVNKTSRGY